MKDTFKKTLAMLLLLVVINLSLFSVAEARSVRVRGYYKPSTGRYIMPHYRTSPNRTKWDNWSTKGNYNPYTGKKGHKSSWSW
jgi:hypothetical protein